MAFEQWILPAIPPIAANFDDPQSAKLNRISCATLAYPMESTISKSDWFVRFTVLQLGLWRCTPDESVRGYMIISLLLPVLSRPPAG